MKRWTIKLALCLLAGAVVTWAVAWGCALWSPLAPLSKEVLLSKPEVPEAIRSAGFAQAPNSTAVPRLGLRTAKGPGTELYSYRLATATTQQGSIPFSTVTQWSRSVVALSGWPLRAMGWMVIHEGTPLARHGILPTSWLKARPNPIVGPLLPTKILPLGFTLNTLLAASIILGLTEGAGTLRRRARRRKGRCPSCGYDRAGFADGATPCPECGR